MISPLSSSILFPQGTADGGRTVGGAVGLGVVVVLVVVLAMVVDGEGGGDGGLDEVITIGCVLVTTDGVVSR